MFRFPIIDRPQTWEEFAQNFPCSSIVVEQLVAAGAERPERPPQDLQELSRWLHLMPVLGDVSVDVTLWDVYHKTHPHTHIEIPRPFWRAAMWDGLCRGFTYPLNMGGVGVDLIHVYHLKMARVPPAGRSYVQGWEHNGMHR